MSTKESAKSQDFINMAVEKAQGTREGAKAHGVLIGAPTGDALRLITHLDLDDAGMAHAIAVLKTLLHAS